MTKRLACLVGTAALLLGLFVGGCERREQEARKHPPFRVWVASQGKSMLPTFPESCLTEAELVPFSELKVGDTVAFWDYTQTSGEPQFIHHRLVAKQAGSFIAKGDNPDTNPKADRAWVTPENYLFRTTGRWTIFLVAAPPKQ